MRRFLHIAAGVTMLGASSGLGACARYDYTGSLNIRPITGTLTTTGIALATLPPAPAAPLNVAVYDFQDLTGQNKSSFKVGFPEFSRAITQGASTILVDALKTAGNGCWFNVVERGYLDSLLRERKLIQDTYAFLKKDPKSLIDPLKFAEYIVTGGVVSYDSPTQTASGNVLFGGYGGGLSGSKDLVTINLRLVRVRDGLVITSINASRPIVTAAANASVTRVIGRSILDAQVAAGLQEAVQTAVREAIEAGVYELVRQGDVRGIWLRKVVPPPTADADRKPAARASRKGADVADRGVSQTASTGPTSEKATVDATASTPRDVPVMTARKEPPAEPPKPLVPKAAASERSPRPSSVASTDTGQPVDPNDGGAKDGRVRADDARAAPQPSAVHQKTAQIDAQSLTLRGAIADEHARTLVPATSKTETQIAMAQ